jgi:hypothetical protein
MDRLRDSALLEGWIPVRLYWSDDQPMVDWCYLGRRRFHNSSFEQAIGECFQHPFNLLFRHQTPIEVLGQWNAVRPGLQPNGFIFHMSRCGSTLISRMLAALRSNIVISEARPLDSTLRAPFQAAQVSDHQRITWLQWMISALGQPRLGEEERFFIKFDAWNASEIPLVKRAFPTVPWIFVYRDPIEVLVSQLNHRGVHMVPGALDASLFEMDAGTITSIEPEEYCARVLAALCRAALRHHENGGLLINYHQLPRAVWSSISEFFGVSWNRAEIEVMENTAKLNAKNSTVIFEPDSAKKQQQASDRVREAANKWLYPVYEELEAARKRQRLSHI